ncbi:Aquaporin (major intrinsic protein family) [Handroanthus impetiginosus]|uniref:Aquaporin (Major intrinsic protein family) n=1 Tax=Handroanthus impetiginosus TaxID=429701 RepID=A0A2G9HXD4_9LAMI|nr:Aquaporin (major intrinsic protein family) [Handroanthus impetiginosus]
MKLPFHNPSSSTDIPFNSQPKNDQELGYNTISSNANVVLKKALSEMDLTLLRKALAEAIGTYVLMFCITGIVANMHYMGIETGLMEYAATAGLTVIVIVFTIGSISGAHVNPAVTFAFAAVGPFPWSQVPIYILAQVGGSILATYTGKLVYGIKAELMMTKPLHGCTFSAFCVELIATFIVLFLTTSLFNQPQSPGPFSGFVAGVAICLGVLISGPVSGGSMNPARSLGPALVTWRFEHLWIYIVAPIIGAIGGVFVYRILRLQGWSCTSDSVLRNAQVSHSSLH